jgi:hypothetical protein
MIILKRFVNYSTYVKNDILNRLGLPVEGNTSRLGSLPPEIAEQLGYPSSQFRTMRALLSFNYSGETSLTVTVIPDLKIPDDCTMIEMMGVNMALTGKWFNGIMELITPEYSGQQISFNNWVDVPRTVITEDGRVYHDQRLIGEHAWWLSSLITSVENDEVNEIRSMRLVSGSEDMFVTFSDVLDLIEIKAENSSY